MAKYKLTITDLETGKVVEERECDGIAGTAAPRGSGGWTSPISFVLTHDLSAVDRLCLTLALDDARAQLLKDPVVAFCYANKDKFIKGHIACNIAALKKAAGLL